MLQRGEECGIVVIRVALLLNPQEYTPVYVWLATVNFPAVINAVTPFAQTQVLPNVMPPSRTANKMMNF